MKLTLNLTREVRKFDAYSIEKTSTETVVDLVDVVFTPSLTASVLRALADEIDPPKSMANPITRSNFEVLR